VDESYAALFFVSLYTTMKEVGRPIPMYAAMISQK